MEEELMVSLVSGGGGDGEGEGNNRILRRTHFLKPTVSCLHEAAGVPLSNSSTTASWPVKLQFHAWRRCNEEWNTWVFRMESKHGNSWRSAGIYHAIMNTTRDIHRYDDLLLGLAEKWCSKTNTFIFPWGEATITLQDVRVLGGYSVMGSPVSSCVQNRERNEIEMKLIEAGREIQKTRANKACQIYWIKKFVAGGSEIEHEAFLSLWLSRFVIQTGSKTVYRRVFPLAIHLARGFEVALAPAVLTSIYAELSSLKKLLVPLEKNSNGRKKQNEFEFKLFSPFQLVLLWAWERFQDLQPHPKVINLGDARCARWDGVKIRQVENVRLALENAGKSFIWSPYSEIGFDQDLTAKSSKTPEVDSANYCAFKLVRVCETDTQEHEEEHKDIELDVPPVFLDEQKNELGVPPGFLPKQKMAKVKQKDIEFDVPPGFRPMAAAEHKQKMIAAEKKDMELDVPPGFLPKGKMVVEADQMDMELDVPPGFLPKGKMVEAEQKGIELEVRTRKFSTYYMGDQGSENGPISYDGFSGISQSSSSSFTNDGGVKYIVANKAPKREMADNKTTTLHVSYSATINCGAEGGKNSHTSESFVSSGGISKSLFKTGPVAMFVDRAPKGQVLMKTSKRSMEIDLPVSDYARIIVRAEHRSVT